MRLKALLTALLMLLPMPALADVTARYSAGKEEIVIRVDDGGNHRADFANIFSLIRRDGVDYVVGKNPKGEPIATRADALLAMITGQLKGRIGENERKGMPDMDDFQLIRGADETVAGRAGTLWRFGPVKPDATAEQRDRDLIDIVMSADPLLAPVGTVFRDSIGLVLPTFEAMFGEGNFGARVQELFGKGTPIRIEDMVKLVSVDSAEIDAKQFELPATVVEPLAFFEAIEPEAGAKAMPQLH